MPLNSQCRQVLAHLKTLNPLTRETTGLTALEAVGLYRCYRLAARIHDLRDAGHQITSIRKTDRTGKTYAKYFLSSNQRSYLEGSVFSLPRNRR